MKCECGSTNAECKSEGVWVKCDIDGDVSSVKRSASEGEDGE